MAMNRSAGSAALLAALPLCLLSLPAFSAGGGGADAHGIPWAAIGQHAFNLVVLLAVLGFVLRKIIPDALNARKTGVAKDLADSAQARASAQARYDALSAKLDGFEQELAAMRAEAELEAGRERDTILARADADARSVAANAQRAIVAETRRARETLRADAARLAVEIAAEQLRSSIGARDDASLTGDFIDSIAQASARAPGVDHG